MARPKQTTEDNAAAETTPEAIKETKASKTAAKTRKTKTKAEKVSKSEKSAKASVKAEKVAKTEKVSKKKAAAEPVEAAEKVVKAKKFNGFQIATVALLGLSLILSIGSAGYCIYDATRGDAPITFNYAGNDGNSAKFTEGSIAEVAAKVTPGVVSIVTEIRTTSIFGQTSTASAAGTGMIVTADGYVLTNKHVIEDATAIKIVLDDGTTYSDVELAGTDPLNDVAYLKIKNAKDLPTVTLGDSKTITAGQQVIAIGNALGQFQNTITSGIISGTGRSITAVSSDYSSSENLTDLIQTDAAINSGNSGGPLVNAAGEVIGINTATSSEADGIGFAIPISSVKGMLKNIVEKGDASRAYIGVYYVIITPDVASSYDLPVSAGAYLYSASQYSAVVAGGPGAKAGLKEKDIITKINGVPVGQAGSVSSLIGEYMPGDTIQLTVLREGKERAVNLTLGRYGD